MKNILVLTYWSMNEALIQSYTLPYVRIINSVLPEKSKVYLFTLEKKHYQLSYKEKKALKNKLKQEGIHWISAPYHSFGFRAVFTLSGAVLKLIFLLLFKRISTIHAWCTPAGALGWFLSVITGKPLIIDSYEPHAEAMVENGVWKRNSQAFKILFRLEKLQTKRAKICIGLTSKTPQYAFNAYGVEPKKYFIKPACVDTNLFNPNSFKNFSLIDEPDDCSKIICVYAGKTGGIYLEQEIFDFFKCCENYWEGNFKAVVLTNSPIAAIEAFVKNAQLNPETAWFKEVNHQAIPSYLVLGSFAINPVKPVPTKRYCTSIKDGEYWAMGLPVVITPNISDDSDIIADNGTGAILHSLDEKGYIDAIKQIDKLISNTEKASLTEKIVKQAIEYRSFEVAKKVYEEIYG
jgi:glycosyltransferase involved in cell wall biosynthesis